jgi:hypothetical protein
MGDLTIASLMSAERGMQPGKLLCLKTAALLWRYRYREINTGIRQVLKIGRSSCFALFRWMTLADQSPPAAAFWLGTGGCGCIVCPVFWSICCSCWCTFSDSLTGWFGEGFSEGCEEHPTRPIAIRDRSIRKMTGLLILPSPPSRDSIMAKAASTKVVAWCNRPYFRILE